MNSHNSHYYLIFLALLTIKMIKLPVVSFLEKAHGRKKTHFHLKMSTTCFLNVELKSSVLLVNLGDPPPPKILKRPLSI